MIAVSHSESRVLDALSPLEESILLSDEPLMVPSLGEDAIVWSAEKCYVSFGALLLLGSVYEQPPIESLDSILASVLQVYQRFLREYPLVTKSLTAGFVALSGDLLAQILIESRRVDTHRSWTVAAEGMFVSGPLLHIAYNWLDQLAFPNIADWLMVWIQVAIDIFIMDSFFTATLMVTSAILQGRSRQQILSELRHEYGHAAQAAWASSGLTAPLQWINFRYIPVEFRVLITNFQDVLWNAVVSYMAHRRRHVE